MIQRIQSIYLLIATSLVTLSLFMNWSTYVVEGAGFMLSGLKCSVEGVSSTPLTMAIIVGAGLILITLFGYKNRKTQMNLAVVTIIQLLLIMGLFGFVHYTALKTLKSNFTEEVGTGYGIAIILPLIACVLVWLARKQIKKDDDLVKSVDRLR
ncbi:MAG: DUF4293 domain-containing protein [Flavobacteriales bacterium]